MCFEYCFKIVCNWLFWAKIYAFTFKLLLCNIVYSLFSSNLLTSTGQWKYKIFRNLEVVQKTNIFLLRIQFRDEGNSTAAHSSVRFSRVFVFHIDWLGFKEHSGGANKWARLLQLHFPLNPISKLLNMKLPAAVRHFEMCMWSFWRGASFSLSSSRMWAKLWLPL